MKIHRLILLPLCAATVVGCGDEQQIAKAIGVPAELFIRLSIEENLRTAGLKYTVVPRCQAPGTSQVLV